MIKLSELLMESLLLEISTGTPYNYKIKGSKDCRYDSIYEFDTEDIPDIGSLTYNVKLSYYSDDDKLSISFYTEQQSYEEIKGIPLSILKNIMATISKIVKDHIIDCYENESIEISFLSFVPLPSTKDNERNSEHNRRAVTYIRVITQQLKIPASDIKKEDKEYIVPINMEELLKLK